MQSDSGSTDTPAEKSPALVVDLALALLFLAVCLFAFISTWDFPQPIGERDPGPAALPRSLSLLGVVLSATLVVLTLRRRGGWGLPRPGRPMVVYAWTVLCLAVEPRLGYVATIVSLVFGITLILGIRRIWLSATFSVATAFGTNAFFANVLGIPL